MSDPDSKKSLPGAGSSVDSDTRREFLKTVGLGGLGAGLGVVVAAPAVAYVSYPLRHSTVSDSTGFLPAGHLTRFKEGVPVKVDLYADKRDGWNRILEVKVGSAWVVRTGTQLAVYSSVCPHLGCAIDYDQDDKKFKCPCHHSTFKLDGTVEGGPAPRPMDSLEAMEKDGKLAIKYRRYKQGVAEKEPV